MSRKGRKWLISSILNEEKTSKISSSWCLSQCFNAPSIRNRSINIIEKKEEDTISRRLVRCNYTKYNGRMVNSCIKVIHESKNQDLQTLVTIIFNELFI